MGIGQAVRVPGATGHVKPQVCAHAVAHAKHVALSTIEQPGVVIAKAEETVILLGRIFGIQELDAEVQLVGASVIGRVATSLDLGKHGLGES